MNTLLLVLAVASIVATVTVLAACVVAGRNRRHLAILLFVLWLPWVNTAPANGHAVECGFKVCGGR